MRAAVHISGRPHSKKNGIHSPFEMCMCVHSNNLLAWLYLGVILTSFSSSCYFLTFLGWFMSICANPHWIWYRFFLKRLWQRSVDIKCYIVTQTTIDCHKNPLLIHFISFVLSSSVWRLACCLHDIIPHWEWAWYMEHMRHTSTRASAGERAHIFTSNVNGNVPLHVASEVYIYKNSIFTQDLFTIVIKNPFRVQYNEKKRTEKKDVKRPKRKEKKIKLEKKKRRTKNWKEKKIHQNCYTFLQ